jgi:uncharacterized protein YkwD
VTSLAVAALVLAVGACPDADLQPGTDTLARVGSAIVCLLNEERFARDTRGLRQDVRLDRSSTAHSADMVEHHYLAHEQPGRPRLRDRVATARYFDGAWSGLYSENVGAAPAGAASAAELVRAWMGSPSHRANVLDGRFRHIGVGIAFADPDPAFYADHPSVVFTTDFGMRIENAPAGRRRRCRRRPRVVRLEFASAARKRRCLARRKPA